MSYQRRTSPRALVVRRRWSATRSWHPWTTDGIGGSGGPSGRRSPIPEAVGLGKDSIRERPRQQEGSTIARG